MFARFEIIKLHCRDLRQSEIRISHYALGEFSEEVKLPHHGLTVNTQIKRKPALGFTGGEIREYDLVEQSLLLPVADIQRGV